MVQNISNTVLPKENDEDDFRDILEDIHISLLKSWKLAIFTAILCAVISYKSVLYHTTESSKNKNTRALSISTNKIDHTIQTRYVPSNAEQEKFRKIAKYMG